MGHPPAYDGPAIAVSDLRMRYGDKDVLTGLDLEIEPGGVTALLGPNGAGKTTTIEILEGFRARSGGDVRVLGVDPAGGGEAWRAGLGVVLQEWRDNGKWKVRDIVAHFAEYYRPYTDPWGASELLELVGLADQGRQRVQTLSGGQRRRLDVALGIIGRPALLFLDEPTTGFDPHARREFHELIHRLTDLDGTTILLTTHDLDEAEKLAERILILAGGRIIADGSPDQLARAASTTAEVKWIQDGKLQIHATEDATDFVRSLLATDGGAVTELEIHRASLEDAYLELVAKFEAGQAASAVDTFLANLWLASFAKRGHPMSTNTLHEYRTGWKRALIETKVSLTSPGDLMGFVMPTGIAIVVLLFMQGADYEGAPVSLGSMNMPSLIGMNVVFGGITAMVGALAMDRTNGTLLRAKSMPGGMTGYLVGHLVSTAMFTGVTVVALLAVGLPLFDGLEFGTPDRWLTFVAVLLMGIVAALPIGAVLGAIIDNPRNMGLVIFPIMGLVAISGIFYPITALPGWLQGIGQVFPIYWMGLGMRHALLPDAMAAVEIGGEWRTVTMFAVLAVWAVVSMALAPRLLRRMSRRESGSAVAARRADMQRDW